MKKLSILMLGICGVLYGCGGGSGASAPAPEPPPAAAPTGDVSPPEPPQTDEPPVSVLTPPEGDLAPESLDEPEAPQPTQADEFAMADYAPPESDIAPQYLASILPGALEPAAHDPRKLHVSPNGADANPGTAERPFRSLARAARAVHPGSVVLVAPGTYSGGFRTTISGTEHARIAFVSTRKWGARIIPARRSPNKSAWDNRGSFVDIVGFDVDGRQHQDGVRWTHGIYSGGSYSSIRNNRVRHIAQLSRCTRAGGSAIGVDSYYRGVRSDVIANLVHDIGPAGCRFMQGIYVSTSARVKNNVVYRVAEGGIHLWHDAHNVIITNNTITASNTGIIIGGGNFYHRSDGNDYTAVYSNIVYDNKMGISEQGKTGRNNAYKNNLVYRNAAYNWRLKNGVTHSGTVSAAPGFPTDARSGTPNLRPPAASPAVGRATALHADSVDFDGRPRNTQAGYDIGAYQH